VLLSSAGWQVNLAYVVVFLRQQFLIPIGWVSIITIFNALGYMAGSLVADRLIKMIGRKRVTILGVVLVGLFSTLYLNLSSFWISYPIFWLAVVLGGVRFTASNSFALEQVPTVRSTMMSLNSTSMALGSVVGASLGGIILLMGDWSALGILIGLLYVMSAIIYFVATIDPRTIHETVNLHPEVEDTTNTTKK
jgi:MFS family permease